MITINTLCLSILVGLSGIDQKFSFLQFATSLAGVPRLNTPPLLPNTSMTSNQERVIVAPRPIRTSPNLVNRLEDLSQPWTRSPTKSKMEPIVATWHFISSDTSHGSSVVGKCPLPGRLLQMFIKCSW
jgi:hypothetical protein